MSALQKLSVNLALAVVLVAVWKLSLHVFDIPQVIFPAPEGVALALWRGLFVDFILWPHLAITVYQIVAAFFIGSAIGLVLGVLIAESALVRLLLHPYVMGFQNVPKVAIAPLFVIWFGFGPASKIAIGASIAFFPVVINVIAGLNAADPGRLELVHVFGGSRFSKFFLVKAPTALPYLFAGLDIAIVLSIIGSIVGEFVGAREGIGYLIMQYNFALDMNGMFSALILYTIIGFLFHNIIKYAGRKAIFWTSAPAGSSGLGL